MSRSCAGPGLPVASLATRSRLLAMRARGAHTRPLCSPRIARGFTRCLAPHNRVRQQHRSADLATNDQKQKAWENATTVRGRDPALYRKDPYGNLMFKPSCGKGSELGRDVDHITPTSRGVSDATRNLQALNSAVNPSKSDTLQKKSRHSKQEARIAPPDRPPNSRSRHTHKSLSHKAIRVCYGGKVRGDFERADSRKETNCPPISPGSDHPLPHAECAGNPRARAGHSVL